MVSEAVNTLLAAQKVRVEQVAKELAESKTKKHAMRKAADEATDEYNRLQVELVAENAVLEYLEKIKRQEETFLHEKRRITLEEEDFKVAPPIQAETSNAVTITRPDSKCSKDSHLESNSECTCKRKTVLM